MMTQGKKGWNENETYMKWSKADEKGRKEGAYAFLDNSV